MGIDKAKLAINLRTKNYLLKVYQGNQIETYFDKIESFDEWQFYDFFGNEFDIHFDFLDYMSVSIYQRYIDPEIQGGAYTDHSTWVDPTIILINTEQL